MHHYLKDVHEQKDSLMDKEIELKGWMLLCYQNSNCR